MADRIRQKTTECFEAICGLKSVYLPKIFNGGRLYQAQVKLMMNSLKRNLVSEIAFRLEDGWWVHWSHAKDGDSSSNRGPATPLVKGDSNVGCTEGFTINAVRFV